MPYSGNAHDHRRTGEKTEDLNPGETLAIAMRELSQACGTNEVNSDTGEFAEAIAGQSGCAVSFDARPNGKAIFTKKA